MDVVLFVFSLLKLSLKTLARETVCCHDEEHMLNAYVTKTSLKPDEEILHTLHTLVYLC